MNEGFSPTASAKGSIPRVLSIAGTDPSGGAGIQADLKSIAAAGGYGMTVITSLVAQNTQGVREVHTPPLDFLEQQFSVIFDDIEVDAIKIGMLASTDIIEVVTKWLRKVQVPLVVLDPVMVASSGDRLQSEDAIEALRAMLEFVDIVTPNTFELGLLCGAEAPQSMEDAIEQSLQIAERYNVAVVAKGGHLTEADAGNAVIFPDGTISFVSSPRVATKNTHGTGCSLSSALTTRIAAGSDIPSALSWSTRWLRDSIVAAEHLHVGHGHGPIDHSHRSRYLARAAQTDANPLPVVPATSTIGGTLTPRLAPAGPFTQALWDNAHELIKHALSTEFITRMTDCTLDPQDFQFYMEQDSLFLTRLFSLLSIIGSKAPTPQTKVIWSSLAQNSIVTLSETFTHELGISMAEVDQYEFTPTTTDLVAFFKAHATMSSYVVGASAMLAGFWLFAEAALQVSSVDHSDSAFKTWIETYTESDYIETVQLLIRVTEEALAQSSALDVLNAGQAFVQACLHELRFLDQPYRRW